MRSAVSPSSWARRPTAQVGVCMCVDAWFYGESGHVSSDFLDLMTGNLNAAASNDISDS